MVAHPRSSVKNLPTCILLGTSPFALPSAETLRGASTYTFLGIITKPDEPSGRGRVMTPPPLAVWANEHGAECWQPETKEALTALLRELRPDVAIVVAYGKIIPPDALTIPRFGFVNLHPSLLPKYRGPSPIQAAIANGDTEAGVTLMLLDAQVDHGPTLAQERVPLSPTATRSSLEQELAERGAALLERTLPDYLTSRITPKPQDDAQATTTPLLSRDHGRIDWREPAAVIERKTRAYEDWPGTWTTASISPPLSEGERLPAEALRAQRSLGGVGAKAGEGVRAQNDRESDLSSVASAKEERGRNKRLKILSATVGTTTSLSPGTIDRSHGRLNVACGDGRLLTLLTVQPEGKPTMDGKSFLLGHRNLFALE